jgi:hypothetical protein
MWTPPTPERQSSSGEDSHAPASRSSSSPSLVGHAAHVLGAVYTSMAKPLFLRAVHASAVPVSVMARQVGGLVASKAKDPSVATSMTFPSEGEEPSSSSSPYLNQGPGLSLKDLFLEQEQEQEENDGDGTENSKPQENNNSSSSSSSQSQVSVKSFLKDVSNDKDLLRNFRMMSSMSEQAYYTLNPLMEEGIWKRYGLRLVVTSKQFQQWIRKEEGLDRPLDVFGEGDGMAVPFLQEEEIVQVMKSEMEKDLQLEDMYYDEWQAKLQESVANSQEAKQEQEQEEEQTAVQKALEAAKTFTTFVSGYTKSLHLGGGGGGGEGNSSSEGGGPSGANKKLPDNDPCEWFIADHPSDPVRYISLQGSDSVDHWVTNLSFEPIDFEGGDLNVKIHAGIYKAAQKLESQLFPAMEEHIARHGRDKAKFVFTGHSLGGAIASTLVMMLVHRKQLEGSMVEAIYTYGCPAFICESCDCGKKSDDCTCGAAGGNQMLLERLNLKSSLFKHLCMARDIVPKAFACDYTMIKEILRKMDTYKDHGCLKGSKGECYFPSLYRHLGDVYFLQPDTKFLQFARPEGDNPILPNGHGIWKMVEPPQSLKLAMNTMNRITSSLQSEWAFGDDLTLYNYAQDVNQAIGEVLNSPHPLEQLSETNAYGHEGGISRFHKPKNYTRAVGVLLMDKHGFMDQTRGSD